ncbi:MAG: DUF3788 domain-containing protein [Oscillospiraceae bacterium]|jgi:hypothetical protein|nr:DUF3788 domain-containing protein [Oscillospiraceae bacterium]
MIPTVTNSELQTIMPPAAFELWQALVAQIDALYDMSKEWDNGGKDAKYLLRFRRGGKTLVTLFPKEDGVGLMVIYGKDERAKFEAAKADFSEKVIAEYEAAKTYHDGKWIMFQLPDDDVERDLPALLKVKRRKR